jgi:glyoxylase-like metal-dependent hydrolase (beta-lactamase superfamily II)
MAYDQPDFVHDPQWIFHGEPESMWFDFKAIRLDFQTEMYLIPLTGHTRGHCGVAVKDGNGWLFHAADALPANVKYDLLPDWIYRRVIGSHVPRLKAFAGSHPEVRMLAGHMSLDWFEKDNAK